MISVETRKHPNTTLFPSDKTVYKQADYQGFFGPTPQWQKKSFAVNHGAHQTKRSGTI
jgi:hypothetical protein